MTKQISIFIVSYWRAMPVLLSLVIWLFFSGTGEVRKRGRRKLLREALLLTACFGFLFGLTCFACYGLVDPTNGLAKPAAIPVSEAELARFAWLGYGAMVVAALAGGLLEWELRRDP